MTTTKSLVKKLVKSTHVSAFEWLLALRVLAVGAAYLATIGDDAIHALVLANIAALVLLTGMNWARNCRERLGDLLPAVYEEMRAASLEWRARELGEPAFHEAVEVALARAPQYSRHVGIVNLHWAIGGMVAPTDNLRLRAALRSALRGQETLCFVDEQQALLLTEGVRSYDELMACRRRLADAVSRNGYCPALVVGQGAAMSPMHGYAADDLIAFAQSGSRDHNASNVVTALHAARPTPARRGEAAPRRA
jgi:hypothetical protein